MATTGDRDVAFIGADRPHLSRVLDSGFPGGAIRSAADDSPGPRLPLVHACGELPFPTDVRRLTILIDALNPRAQRSEHPPQLVNALSEAGMQVELHWVSAGLLARLDRRSSLATDGGSLEGAWTQVLSTAPDAVLAYDAASPAAWLGARIARREGIPLILVEPAWFSLRPFHERILDGIGRRLWGRRVRQEAQSVIALDPVAVERALQSGFARERVELIPTGVDTAAFAPGATSPLLARHRLAGRIVLNVGPLVSGRGLENLLTAWARTVGQRSDWSLVFAGEGPLRRRLETVASRLGVRAGVRFLPAPQREELPGLFCASTLLAVPAEDDRVRGRQVVRAMASGLPVIVEGTPRLAFRVDHERTGYVVDPGDPSGWTQALERAAGAPRARADWAVTARAMVERELDWSRLAERYSERIENAIELERRSDPSRMAFE